MSLLDNGMLSFVDLFSGIGGFRLAFEKTGFTCLASSEINRFAIQTYRANFGDTPLGDIRDIQDLPYCDVMTGGFPCQSFSEVRRKAKASGFADPKTGQLFFEVVRLLDKVRPKAFLLENVLGLLKHERGKTFATIQQTIRDLGYSFHWQLIDAALLVPQRRKRVYMVGFRDGRPFDFPEIEPTYTSLKNILEPDPDPSLTLSDRGWQYLLSRTEVNSFFKGKLHKPEEVCCTLMRTYRHNPLLFQEGKNPRKLSVREAARLMGFPEEFVFPCSRTQSYAQLGNAVVPPIVERIAGKIRDSL